MDLWRFLDDVRDYVKLIRWQAIVPMSGALGGKLRRQGCRRRAYMEVFTAKVPGSGA